jgi:hypothetical protein
MAQQSTGTINTGYVNISLTNTTLSPMAGSTIDMSLTNNGRFSYQVAETGGVNNLNFKLQGSNDAVTWFDMTVINIGTTTNTALTNPVQVSAGTSIVVVPFMPQSAPRYVQLLAANAISNCTLSAIGIGH